MITRTSIATISYNSVPFLVHTLNELIERGVIEFYAFIDHMPESDETKSHKHLFIIPSSNVDTFSLQNQLKEVDLDHPDLPPLGCIMFRHSKFSDWFLYCQHDRDYLAMRGELKEFIYTKDDFIVSDKDYFNELIHTSDFSKFKIFQKLRDAVSSDVSFRDLVSNGFVPVPQIVQYRMAYNIMKYGVSNYDEEPVSAENSTN